MCADGFHLVPPASTELFTHAECSVPKPLPRSCAQVQNALYAPPTRRVVVLICSLKLTDIVNPDDVATLSTSLKLSSYEQHLLFLSDINYGILCLSFILQTYLPRLVVTPLPIP